MFFCPFPEVSHVITSDVEACRSKLAGYYRRTAKVPTSVWSSVCQVKLDQIYTRLSWVEKEKTPTGLLQLLLTDYSELFTADENGFVPNRILVEGETGIGKSTFVKKLALDWAKRVDEKDAVNEEMAASSKCGGGQKPSREDHVGVSQAESSETRKQDDSRASHTDALKKFQLVIVVPLKFVSKCQTFKEVLSCSRLIPRDEESLSDDLFTYVCNNQEKVLLVFDGYDEYRTGSVAEAQFGPRSTSPICEVFHGNELRDCTVLVTTRSSRAGELQESADKHAVIIGFDIADQMDFMTKVLGSNSQFIELVMFLYRNNLLDLARVPLLNLFFCLLFRQEKEKLMELSKRKTPLYRTIIRYILQYSNKRLSSAKISKVEDEDYQEVLTEMGKVALESLLKGSQVFEYGQLSEKVRGEEGVMLGLLQLSENEASLEPTEIVSFIHKSIQEYLAALFIAYRCVSEGNLGGIESYAATLEDCESVENVLQYVCGFTKEGAVKVLTHLSTVRANDSTLDFSMCLPFEETKTDLPWTGITKRHERFNDLVLSCFQEVALEPELTEHVFGCTGGIILLGKPIDINLILKPKVLTQHAKHSWAFFLGLDRLVHRFGYVTMSAPTNSVRNLYESVKFLDLLHIPLRLMRNSNVLELGDLLTKFLNCDCSNRCTFNSVLCFRDGKAMVYITDLRLNCDTHISIFTEAVAAVSDQSLSANLCSSQLCMKFLTSLSCFFHENGKLLKELGVMVRNCNHLQEIRFGGKSDHLLDFLEHMGFPGNLFLTINVENKYHLLSNKSRSFAYTVPRREESLFLIIDLPCNSTERVIAIVSGISPESLWEVSLNSIVLTPSVAATLGEALPKMTSLRKLHLEQNIEGSLQALTEMKTLFGGLNQVLPLGELCLRNSVYVQGSSASLTESFRFFADLKKLVLSNVTLDEEDLSLLLESFRFTPNLRELILEMTYDIPFRSLIRVIVSYQDKLPELRKIEISSLNSPSEEDLEYLRKAATKLRPDLLVDVKPLAWRYRHFMS